MSEIELLTTGLVSTSNSLTLDSTLCIHSSNKNRKVSLIIPNGTTICGNTSDFTQIGITEFTKDDNHNAMPADLPINTAFTYCIDFHIPNNQKITFDKPVNFFVRDFLNLPIGTKIPVGYYNYETSKWENCDDGFVIELNKNGSINDGNGLNYGMMEVDSSNVLIRYLNKEETILKYKDICKLGEIKFPKLTSNGFDLGEYTSKIVYEKDNDKEIPAQIISIDELKNLRNTYFLANTSIQNETESIKLCKYSINHFSSYDCNHRLFVPRRPLPKKPKDKKKEDEECGTIINIENRVLRENIDFNGTEYSLFYSSERAIDNDIFNLKSYNFNECHSVSYTFDLSNIRNNDNLSDIIKFIKSLDSQSLDSQSLDSQSLDSQIITITLYPIMDIIILNGEAKFSNTLPLYVVKSGNVDISEQIIIKEWIDPFVKKSLDKIKSIINNADYNNYSIIHFFTKKILTKEEEIKEYIFKDLCLEVTRDPNQPFYLNLFTKYLLSQIYQRYGSNNLISNESIVSIVSIITNIINAIQENLYFEIDIDFKNIDKDIVITKTVECKGNYIQSQALSSQSFNFPSTSKVLLTDKQQSYKIIETRVVSSKKQFDLWTLNIHHKLFGNHIYFGDGTKEELSSRIVSLVTDRYVASDLNLISLRSLSVTRDKRVLFSVYDSQTCITKIYLDNAGTNKTDKDFYIINDKINIISMFSGLLGVYYIEVKDGIFSIKLIRFNNKKVIEQLYVSKINLSNLYIDRDETIYFIRYNQIIQLFQNNFNQYIPIIFKYSDYYIASFSIDDYGSCVYVTCNKLKNDSGFLLNGIFDPREIKCHNNIWYIYDDYTGSIWISYDLKTAEVYQKLSFTPLEMSFFDSYNSVSIFLRTYNGVYIISENIIKTELTIEVKSSKRNQRMIFDKKTTNILKIMNDNEEDIYTFYYTNEILSSVKGNKVLDISSNDKFFIYNINNIKVFTFSKDYNIFTDCNKKETKFKYRGNLLTYIEYPKNNIKEDLINKILDSPKITILEYDKTNKLVCDKFTSFLNIEKGSLFESFDFFIKNVEIIVDNKIICELKGDDSYYIQYHTNSNNGYGTKVTKFISSNDDTKLVFYYLYLMNLVINILPDGSYTYYHMSYNYLNEKHYNNLSVSTFFIDVPFYGKKIERQEVRTGNGLTQSLILQGKYKEKYIEEDEIINYGKIVTRAYTDFSNIENLTMKYTYLDIPGDNNWCLNKYNKKGLLVNMTNSNGVKTDIVYNNDNKLSVIKIDNIEKIKVIYEENTSIITKGNTIYRIELNNNEDISKRVFGNNSLSIQYTYDDQYNVKTLSVTNDDIYDFYYTINNRLNKIIYNNSEEIYSAYFNYNCDVVVSNGIWYDYNTKGQLMKLYNTTKDNAGKIEQGPDVLLENIYNETFDIITIKGNNDIQLDYKYDSGLILEESWNYFNIKYRKIISVSLFILIEVKILLVISKVKVAIYIFIYLYIIYLYIYILNLINKKKKNLKNNIFYFK